MINLHQNDMKIGTYYHFIVYIYLFIHYHVFYVDLCAGLWYTEEGKTQKERNPNLSTINPLQLYRTAEGTHPDRV